MLVISNHKKADSLLKMKKFTACLTAGVLSAALLAGCSGTPAGKYGHDRVRVRTEGAGGR